MLCVDVNEKYFSNCHIWRCTKVVYVDHLIFKSLDSLIKQFKCQVMGLLAAVGIIVVIYYAIQFLLWSILDCDIELFLASHFGRPISECDIYLIGVKNVYT